VPEKTRAIVTAMFRTRMAANGEVEGSGTHAGRATRAHTVSRRPRSQTGHASRTPPTIVRRHARGGLFMELKLHYSNSDEVWNCD
jgi:hypothetical protein